LKLTNQAEGSRVSVVFAQAKLPPKQATTIPRLELCAAVLASKAVKWITRELKLRIDKVIFYTDSKVVLGCIHNKSRRFYVYVANIIQIIRSITYPSQWRYVETKENPADIATFKRKICQNLMESVWFEGPEFLRNVYPPAQTELSPEPFLIADNNPEVRVKTTIYSTQLRVIKGLTSESDCQSDHQSKDIEKPKPNFDIPQKECPPNPSGQTTSPKAAKKSICCRTKTERSGDENRPERSIRRRNRNPSAEPTVSGKPFSEVQYISSRPFRRR
jgi:hypothetical protein